MGRIIWNYTGAMGTDKATPVAKVGYPYGKEKNQPKVYTLIYDAFTFKILVNGVESMSFVRPEGGVGDIGEIVLAADYDDTAWFKGILPELVLFNSNLNDDDRKAYENYLADKWLPNGTVLNGHEVTATASKPTITSGQAFLDFNETGLTLDGSNRVSQWQDSSTLGGQRTALPHNTLLPTVKTVKGKNALYFDNKGFFRIAADSAPENNPHRITIMFVCQFDNYYANQFGDADQTLFASSNNSKFRVKKYDEDTYISARLINWDGYNMSIRAYIQYVLPYYISEDILGYLTLYTGPNLVELSPAGVQRQVDNYSQYGVIKWPLTGLNPNTIYWGKWKFSRLPDGTSDPYLDYAKSGKQYEFYKNLLEVRKEVTTNDYQTVRTNQSIPLNSGLYYFEAIIKDKDTSSAIWLGLIDSSIPYTTAVGLAGWSVSSNGRKFAKQTGGGTTWGGSGSVFGIGDTVGILYNSNTGSLTMYKNGVIVGTPHTGLINTPVEAMIAIDKMGSVELKFERSGWTNPNVLLEWNTLPYIAELPDDTTAFKFKTLPSGPSSYKIIAGSCNFTASESSTFDEIVNQNPDLFIHMGDLHYLNIDSIYGQKYAEGLDETLKSQKLTTLLRSMGWEYKYDNHDSIKATPNKNDASWPYFIDFFLKVHAHQPVEDADPQTNGIYGKFRMGRALIITTDLRRARDPQNQTDNPTKSILGASQKDWLKQTLLDAKADSSIGYIIWVSSVLWTADRNDPRGDSFLSWGASWGSYEVERAEIANFIYENQIKNIFFICGDTHMQAIDDGRNSCYITSGGNRVDPNTIDKAYWMPVLEASPFHQDPEPEGGPFNVNDTPNSGGPVTSYAESYGLVEILDRGENWVQVKLTTNANVPGQGWRRNRFYTFNLTLDNGIPGLPPPLDWVDPTSTNANYNGYVGVNEVWRNVNQRFIRTQNSWKPMVYKWKFINNEWKVVYDYNLLNPGQRLQLFQLNWWTFERLNWIRIEGKGLLDASYPVNYGAYYEMSRNASDLFENYASLTILGNPAYQVTDGVQSVVFPTMSDYFRAPTAIGSGIFFNDLYNRDFFMGIWVYVPLEGLPVADQLVPLISNMSSTKYFAIKQTGSEVSFEINLGGTAIKTATQHLTKGAWNKLALLVKAKGGGEYTFVYVNGIKEQLIGFEVPDMGSSEVTPIFTYIGEPNTSSNFRPKLSSFYLAPRYLDEGQINIYNTKPPVDIIMKSEADGSEYVVPLEWRMKVTNEGTSFTLPPDAPIGKQNIFLRVSNIVSNVLPVKIIDTVTTTSPVSIVFNSNEDINNNFFIMHKAWGGANGGVVAQNVEVLGGKLHLYGNGDLYDGKIQGVDRNGKPKFHTAPGDPKLNEPWTNRVGACLVYKNYTGFGSYRVRAKIPTELGLCSAFWTFFYNEIYPDDPRYSEYESEGLHQQGNEEDGYYITRNHEIDIELPSHLDGGVLSEPSFNNMKCNTWRGELQNWDVPPTDPAYWEEYRDNLTPTGIDMYTGEEHEFRFDWYKDRVEFFIDGVLKRTNTNTSKGETIPDIIGHFTFGVWFPSSPLPGKPWLVNPAKGWAGGVIDSDGGQKAMFNRVRMEVSKFEFIPFVTTGLRIEAETYPFGGYQLKTTE